MLTADSAPAAPEEGAAILVTEFSVPPATVFRAFTVPDVLTQWLAERATVEARAGGRYDLTVAPDALEVSGIFILFEPGRGLLASWEAEGVEESMVELAIDETAEGCRVTLRHRGLPSAFAVADYTERWAAALERLAHVLSGAD